MLTNLETVVESYVRAKGLTHGTRDEHLSIVRKWKRWGGGNPIEKLTRKQIREFPDWVHEQAVLEEGSNPGRTANKSRANLRAIMSWAWEQDLIQSLPRFPKPRRQRDVAGQHYLTKSELNALYFATHDMQQPRGWKRPFLIGRYWRAALVMFFNFGLDTGTDWKSTPVHEPILWRHVSWDSQSPDGQSKSRSRWGWFFYRRIKTSKTFYRPMTRTVHAHLKSVMPNDPDPNEPVFFGGGSRPNRRFQQLCALASIKPKTDVETGVATTWLLKDLRKTCAPTTTSTFRSLRLRSWATPSVGSRTGITPTVTRLHLRQS